MGVGVMISSTLVDMEEERIATIEKILRMGHQPVVSEHWPSTGGSITQLSKQAAETCGVYVCVIGDRYGSPPPGGEQRSYTEIEFDAAWSAKKRLSVFVKANPRLLGDDEAAFEQLRKRQAFVKKIRSLDILALNWSDRHELTSLLGDALVAHERELMPVMPIAPTRPERREPLPVHPYALLKSEFAGRKRQLADLDNWALGQTPILTLVAHGGYGKSALAWTWFRRQTEREDSTWHGAVYFSFYRRDATYESLIARLHKYLIGPDVEGPPAPSFGVREEAVLSCLAAERVLLVLDGFEDQLEAHNRLNANVEDNRTRQDETGDFARISDRRLLNFLGKLVSLNAKSRVLITSRFMPQDFVFGRGLRKGFTRKELGGFDLAEAKEFWGSLNLDPDDPDLAEFVDRMSGYPLAIQVAASQLGHVVTTLCQLFKRSPDFNPLRDGLTRDEARDDVFRAALFSLSDSERWVLRTLAWLREPPSLQLLVTLLCRRADLEGRPFSDRNMLRDTLDLLVQNDRIHLLDDRYYLVRDRGDGEVFKWRQTRFGDENESDAKGVSEIIMQLRYLGDGQTLEELALKVCDTRPFATPEQLENSLTQLVLRSLVGVESGRGKDEPARFDLHPVIRGVIKARESSEAEFLTNTQIVQTLRSEIRSHDVALTVHDVEPRIQLFLSLIQSGEASDAAVESNDLRSELSKFDAHQLERQVWAEFFRIDRAKGNVNLAFKFDENEFGPDWLQAVSIFSQRLAFAAEHLQDWDLAIAGHYTHQTAGYCLNPMCHAAARDAMEARGLFASSENVLANAVESARKIPRAKFDSHIGKGHLASFAFVERALLNAVGYRAVERGDSRSARLCIVRHKNLVDVFGSAALKYGSSYDDDARDQLLLISRLAALEKSHDTAIAIGRRVLEESDKEGHLSHKRQALMRLGVLYGETGRHAEAEDMFEHYRDLDPSGPNSFGTVWARVELVRALIGQKRFDDAERILQAATVEAKDFRNQALLADCLLAKAAFEGALGDADAERAHLNDVAACFQVETGTRRGWAVLEKALTQLRQKGWEEDVKKMEGAFASPLHIPHHQINPMDDLHVSDHAADFQISDYL